MCQARSCKREKKELTSLREKEEGTRTNDVEGGDAEHRRRAEDQVQKGMVTSDGTSKESVVTLEAIRVEPSERFHLVNEDALPKHLHG